MSNRQVFLSLIFQAILFLENQKSKESFPSTLLSSVYYRLFDLARISSFFDEQFFIDFVPDPYSFSAEFFRLCFLSNFSLDEFKSFFLQNKKLSS